MDLDILDVSELPLEERSLAEIARKWEQQLYDLRNFSFLEKEAQESESDKLFGEKEGVIEELRERLLALEGEKAELLFKCEESIKSQDELVVKMQLMESALSTLSERSAPETAQTVDASTSPQTPIEKTTVVINEQDHMLIGSSTGVVNCGAYTAPTETAEDLTDIAPLPSIRRKLIDAEILKQQRLEESKLLRLYDEYSVQQELQQHKRQRLKWNAEPLAAIPVAAAVNIMDQHDHLLVSRLAISNML